MLVGANDGEIDHLDAGMIFAGLVQGLKHHIPHAYQRPAPELPIDRVPRPEMAMQVPPRRSRSRDPEHTPSSTRR